MKKLFFVLIVLVISSFVLTSCEGKGKLVIKEPPNADVYINGKYVGKTPLEITLKEGKYDIMVATSPYDVDEKKAVQIYFDKTTVLSFHPKPKGRLIADTKPEGAEVLDGKYPIGKTPLDTLLDVGEHIIVFKYQGVGASRKVNIEYQKTTKLFVNLEKAVIHFKAEPSDAILYVDGKKIGTFPKVLELDEGTHEIVVEKGVFKDRFVIKVKKGEEKTVRLTLQDVQLPPIQAYGPIAFTNDHKYLITMGKGGIYFWDFADLKPHIVLYDPEDVRNFDKFSRFALSDNNKFVVGIKPIKALAYKLKEKNLPATKILVWQNNNVNPLVSTILSEDIYGGAFGKNSKTIYLSKKDGTILIFDISSKKVVDKLKLPSNITDIKSSNGNIFVSDDKGTIYKVVGKEIVSKAKVHRDKINSLEISSDKTMLITSSDDKTVKLVSVSDLSTKDTFSYDEKVISANISPKNSKIAAGVSTNKVFVRDVESKKDLYVIKNLTAPPISVAFKDEKILITASSVKKPKIDLWEDGHLLKKWVLTLE